MYMKMCSLIDQPIRAPITVPRLRGTTGGIPRFLGNGDCAGVSELGSSQASPSPALPVYGLALPISAWGIAEHAVHQLPGCRDVSKAAKS